MNQLELQIPKGMIPDVLALATQYYANQIPNWTVSEFVEAGTEIYLAPELIERAIHEIQIQRVHRMNPQKTSMLKGNPPR